MIDVKKALSKHKHIKITLSKETIDNCLFEMQQCTICNKVFKKLIGLSATDGQFTYAPYTTATNTIPDSREHVVDWDTISDIGQDITSMQVSLTGTILTEEAFIGHIQTSTAI